jgi:hypothetical protein
MEEFITFETARHAKEKGFGQPVMHYGTYQRRFPTTTDWNVEKAAIKNWNDDEGMKFYERVSLPSQAVLQRWLREHHQLHTVVDHYKKGHYSVRLSDAGDNGVSDKLFGEEFATYELALEAGLLEALTFINR